ncbi:hypothetical protein [Pseudomonas akapageensis]|uniref:hypothetical protein n=1 Tax=Pseudomonas akapageensis TaxID=2609961 RepID=UPI001409DBB9|nr:hypothetical protein [Pseudomonas akapageensis]
MVIKTRKCAFIFAVAAVIGLYAAAAYRVELARNTPRENATCSLAHCPPQTATLGNIKQ